MNRAIPIVLLTVVATSSVLFVEARTLLKVERGIGNAAAALGSHAETGSSASERVEALETLARELLATRRNELESQRAVAHELKTPLTSIRGLAQLLSGYELSETETRRVASMVADESSRLQEMVDGLLHLERLALRERSESDQTNVDLGEVLVRRATLARGADRNVLLEANDDLIVSGDVSLLERMIENLVGNAMKFSPPDTTIEISGLRRGADVVIEVDDEGPGVPETERPLIFQRFGRGSASKDRPGLGLGLAFVGEIAAWHRGRAEVVTGRRGGALFRVVLPAANEIGAKEVS